jgi:hypothetical protein
MIAHALSDAGLTTLLEAAVAAPSLHNTQPWRFRRGSDGPVDVVEVHADTSRTLTTADPLARSLHTSCGAAVLNLRVAAEHIGYEPRTLLLPSDGTPSHLATVYLLPRAHGLAELQALYAAIPQRRTNRGPYDGRPVPQGLAEELSRAAAAEGVSLRFVNGQEYARLAALVHSADRQFGADARLVAERAAWVGGNRTDDGIPTPALGPVATNADALTRDLGAGAASVSPAERGHTRFEAAPTLAVLETPEDSPMSWLRAGMGLERALLVAAAHGVSASFLNAPVDLGSERWLVRDPSGPWSSAQMVLRLGYGAPAPATPRRPVQGVVDVSGA